MRRKLYMPAITLGLAEVEERLHALRRRLNAVTAQHSVYVSLSVTIVVVSALIILALRGSAATFRAATWSGAILCLAVGVWGWLRARRRWLDVAATARLADWRGGLTDRLVTLVDLQTRPRPARLAPVLVAQLLALSKQWQLRHIAPRRIPRSVLALLASLLALGSTAFIERRPPAPPAHTAAASARTAVAANAQLAAGGGGAQAANGPSVAGLPAAGDLPQESGVGASAAENVPPRGEYSGGAAAGAAQRGEGSQA
ncbi:MAG TPA: hypothetical protein VJ598_10270, partial [Albitalea sp.]|nr:hypothetical protein [Albitalea sp.]